MADKTFSLNKHLTYILLMGMCAEVSSQTTSSAVTSPIRGQGDTGVSPATVEMQGSASSDTRSSVPPTDNATGIVTESGSAIATNYFAVIAVLALLCVILVISQIATVIAILRRRRQSDQGGYDRPMAYRREEKPYTSLQTAGLSETRQSERNSIYLMPVPSEGGYEDMGNALELAGSHGSQIGDANTSARPGEDHAAP